MRAPIAKASAGNGVLKLPSLRRAGAARPVPAATLAHDEPEAFVVAQDLAAWIRTTFLEPNGALYNPDHEHLQDADLGVLWTNAINITRQREVMATAEIPNARAGGWLRARFEYQLRAWFGRIPDFVLTFSAPRCGALSDRAFCAVVEHELFHCAQATDRDGNLRFRKDDGRPVFAIGDHDVSQFVGVVARYGTTGPEERAMVSAALRAPDIADLRIERACGTCLARSA